METIILPHPHTEGEVHAQEHLSFTLVCNETNIRKQAAARCWPHRRNPTALISKVTDSHAKHCSKNQAVVCTATAQWSTCLC